MASAKFILSHNPTVMIVKGGTLNGSANAGLTVFKNAQKQIIYQVTTGFRAPWGESFEIVRLIAKSGNVLINVLDSAGADLLVRTIAAGTPFIGSMIFGGSETVKFTASDEFMMLVRALPGKIG